MPYDTVEEYQKYFKELINEWSPRNEAIKRWYKVLSLYDELEDKNARPEDKLESFVSNDPRVMFNMAKFLLAPNTPIPFNIPAEGVTEVVQAQVANIEAEVRELWTRLDEASINSSNGGTWLDYMVSLLLAEGWFSVFAWADGNNFIADIWNPFEVYPEFYEDGLAGVLNVYTISASAARKKASSANWDWRQQGNNPVTIYNYWCYTEEGEVHNCVIMGNKKVIEETYPDLSRIPVAVGGVAGLPDRGMIKDIDVADWHETVGQSIVAPIETVNKSYNRLMTFMQQITRDSAQPRIVEKVKGGNKVVTSNNWNKRGAIYHLDTDEDIGAVPMPGMPPEISLGLQMMDGMKQRGGFDYSLFQGGQASGYAQQITSSSAQQILLPFKNGRDYVVSFVANTWLELVRLGRAKFPNYVVPREFPENLRFKIDIRISVPGDLMSRAASARQLNPEFTISKAKTIELTMPEIDNPNEEVVRARVDKAMSNPAFGMIDTIEALTQTADALQAEGNSRHAERYRNLAAQYEQQLAQMVNPQQAQPNPPGPPGQMNIT